MPRKAIEIKLTEDQKAQLEKLTRSHSAKRRLVERAAVILSCVTGRQNLKVATEYKISVLRANKWRKRFAEQWLAGLKDGSRPGKPITYRQAFRDTLLSKLGTTQPEVIFGLKRAYFSLKLPQQSPCCRN